MKTTTMPASRFGWQGQTVEYVVRADGVKELSAPAECPNGVQVRIVDTRQVADGIEARVAVDVGEGALY